MNTSQIYILISVITLVTIMIVLILTRKKMQKPLSKLTTLAFLLIFTGIILGENRLIGYSLMVAGGILAIIDIIKKSKRS